MCIWVLYFTIYFFKLLSSVGDLNSFTDQLLKKSSIRHTDLDLHAGGKVAEVKKESCNMKKKHHAFQVA